MPITGSFTALITPFKHGKVDVDALTTLIERQIAAGTHGLVPCGTTGESPTLNHAEHDAVIEHCIRITAGRAHVMAGTGSNSTAEAIEMTQHAQESGANSALIMTPYYNKPTQEGIFQHFKAIHDATNIPIILYNIPGRSVIDMHDDTILRMASELPRVVGIKDATGNLARPEALLKKGIKVNFDQLSGEDETAVEFNQLGGVGCISVTSNIMPKECAEIQNLCAKKDYAGALAIQQKLMPLHKVMFCESNPIPVKYAAHLMGLCSAEFRLPLVMPSAENQAKIKAMLAQFGLV